MRKIHMLLCCAIFLMACGKMGFADSKIVSGKLVDLACYKVNNQNTGNAHIDRGWNCGRSCALEGYPVGVVTSDGKVYQVTGELAAHSNAKLQAHIGETVTISGGVSEKDGLALISATDLK